jgi:hypothetical protein
MAASCTPFWLISVKSGEKKKKKKKEEKKKTYLVLALRGL